MKQPRIAEKKPRRLRKNPFVPYDRGTNGAARKRLFSELARQVGVSNCFRQIS